MMATTATNSASRFSIDSSMPRSHHGESSPWNMPSNSSPHVGPVMGAADSWPALSPSARPSSNKHPSLDDGSSSSSSSSSMPPPPHAGGTPLNANANAESDAAAASSSENHTVNGQRRPFERNNNTASSSSHISNSTSAPPSDHYHSQRGGSYGSGTFRNSQRNRNTSSYPRGEGFHHGNRRNYEHGNQTGFCHRNHSGRDMHLQPQRGVGMMRPHMPMGPPSFPPNSAQFMPAPQIGSYGGPMLYPDYPQHVFMPHPPPDAMAVVGGPFSPLSMYLPVLDAVLYNKILTQVEYYFSADNLSRDEHLRDKMNDEGWVPVREIAGFRRLSVLTNDIQIILESLRRSEVVEIKGETLRRRGDWDKYLLSREPSKSSPAAAAASNNTSLVSQLESMTLSERSREEE